MIDKNWFELDKCKIFDELISEDYQYICLELDNRWFEITSEYYENNEVNIMKIMFIFQLIYGKITVTCVLLSMKQLL